MVKAGVDVVGEVDAYLLCERWISLCCFWGIGFESWVERFGGQGAEGGERETRTSTKRGLYARLETGIPLYCGAGVEVEGSPSVGGGSADAILIAMARICGGFCRTDRRTNEEVYRRREREW